MYLSANTSRKLGRNELCSCGSQLKYKKCCLLTPNTAELSGKKLEAVHDILKNKANRVFGGNNNPIMIHQEQSSIKMSEVIIEFAEEFLDKMHTNSQKKNLLELACLAWNSALFAEEGIGLPDSDELLNSIELKNNDAEARDVLKYILSVLTHKKMDEYSHIDRVIVSYHFTDIGSTFRLDVASVISKKEMQKNGLGLERLKQLQLQK
jgi:hypothetical protein